MRKLRLRAHSYVRTSLAQGDLNLQGWVFGIPDGRIRAYDRLTGDFMEL